MRSSASTASSGASRKATSPSASVKIPPMPSMTQGPNSSSRTKPAISSRAPDTICADQQRDVAVLGAGGGQQLGGGGLHRRGVAQAELHQSPLGLVGDGGAAELDDDGIPDLVGGLGRLLRCGRPALRPAPARRAGPAALGFRLREGGHAA